MRILLVGIFDTDTVGLAPQILSALASASAISHDHVIDTREFSIFSNTVESMIDSINDWHPDVVCFSCYIWNIKLIQQIAPNLDCTIVIGGPQVSGIERETLRENPSIDMVVTGEGEASFLALLEYFSGRRLLEDVPGITTAELSNPPADPVDLATIPPLYVRIFERYPEISWVTFETSRGCPMQCGYCTWGYSNNIRYFPLEYVLSELDVVLENPRIRMIYICDSSLLFNKKRALAILDHLVASGTDKMVRYEFSPNQLDDEIIERMARLPYNEFNFGIQTVNPPALSEIGRPFHKDRFEAAYNRFVEALPDARITVDLIYGLPGDDLVGYLHSINYVMTLTGVSKILTNPLIVLPGSRFFLERHRYGIALAGDGSYMLEENSTFSREEMRDARRISFYVNLLYLNAALKDALLALAIDSNTRPVDRVIDFFETLPFRLVEGEYPYTLPSIKDDFEHRNRVLGKVLKMFPLIVEAFRDYSHHRYDRTLENYEQAFTEQYRKYTAFAQETEALST